MSGCVEWPEKSRYFHQNEEEKSIISSRIEEKIWVSGGIFKVSQSQKNLINIISFIRGLDLNVTTLYLVSIDLERGRGSHTQTLFISSLAPFEIES